MSQKIALLVSLVLAVAIVAGCSDEGPLVPRDQLAADAAATKDAEVPFHFQVYNTIEIVPPPPPPVIHAIFPGEGRSKPFGPFTMHATSEIDVTVFPFHQETEYVFTYSNGDELHGNSVGQAIEDPPGSVTFWGDITITGGTGRFANATGTGTYEGTADTFAGIGQFTIDGTMSGFGGGD